MSAPVTLMERSYGGLNVELRYVRANETVAILVEKGDLLVGKVVDPSKARDAFDHPMCYLDDATVLSLGR